LREPGRHNWLLTRKEVLVPDFALSKAPNYDYLPRTQQFEPKSLYQVGERVAVLNGQYFGCRGTVEALEDKTLRVRLQEDPIKSESRIEEGSLFLMQRRRNS
jgi:transcription antitermination factor NusG